MAIEWSPDYCLVCDRQTLGGAYCSQACRLTELDPLSLESESPSRHTQIPRNSATHSSSRSNTAYSFGSADSNSRTLSVPSSYGFTERRSHPTSDNLAPSPSRTSISSLRSNASQSEMVTGQARNELRDYASCFDQVRDLKRRMTTS